MAILGELIIEAGKVVFIGAVALAGIFLGRYLRNRKDAKTENE